MYFPDGIVVDEVTLVHIPFYMACTSLMIHLPQFKRASANHFQGPTSSSAVLSSKAGQKRNKKTIMRNLAAITHH